MVPQGSTLLCVSISNFPLPPRCFSFSFKEFSGLTDSFFSVLQADGDVQGDAALHEHDLDGLLHPGVCHENILIWI